MTGVDLLWPTCLGPADLERVELVPLAERGLPSSTYEALTRTADEHPDRTALTVLPDGDRWRTPVTITFGQLRDAVTRQANALASLGVARTDTVGLLSVNTEALVPALLAAQAAGIAAPVNPVLDPEHVAGLLARAGARVLIAAGPELEPRIWQLAVHLATQRRLDTLLALRPTGAGDPAAPLDAIPGVRVEYLDELARSHDSEVLAVPAARPTDIAALFHTGGTTGSPKLAAHTHAMEIADAWGVALFGGDDPDWTVFAALPLFHVNALIVTTLAPLLRAQRVVWAGPLGYRDVGLITAFWKLVEEHRINAMSGVPSVYAAMSGVPVDADIASLRLAIVGAAPLPPAVRDHWFTHTGVPLCEGYGLTEATCASARNFPSQVRWGSVGQRMPYQDIAAVDVDPATDDWTFLGADRVGTIVIRGPVVFPGYVVGRDEDGLVIDAGSKVRDGWLDTGDLGSVSADGYVTLTGRAKDVIIRGGHNIDPTGVEDVLRQHPAVSDVGVVGRPNQHSGEVPVAFVTLSDPAVDAATLREWAAARVPEPAAAPQQVTVLPELPYTAIGKPYKLGLRMLATRQELSGKLTALGSPPPESTEWVGQREGQLTVALPTPTDPALRDAVAALMSAYSLDWRFL
jgi:fatty-acyl-CoA synthase